MDRFICISCYLSSREWCGKINTDNCLKNYSCFRLHNLLTTCWRLLLLNLLFMTKQTVAQIQCQAVNKRSSNSADVDDGDFCRRSVSEEDERLLTLSFVSQQCSPPSLSLTLSFSHLDIHSHSPLLSSLSVSLSLSLSLPERLQHCRFLATCRPYLLFLMFASNVHTYLIYLSNTQSHRSQTHKHNFKGRLFLAMFFLSRSCHSFLTFFFLSLSHFLSVL